ncbi:substrate-binding periplasmic protein [Chitinimonas sp.]|uniref:substrate-binding periplasmic protein n=1 Tax=Chitinimonas sp. TaxID=1934313 RepID=UPI0035AE7DB2
MLRLVQMVFLFVVLLSSTAKAEVWSVRADTWCPYNCEPGSANPGYMIEILDQAAKATGNKVDYKLMPWARALEEVRADKITAVVGLTDGDRDGLLVSDKMGLDATCFFVNEGDSFKYHALADLSRLASVGTASGYEYADDFMKWAKANPGRIQPITGDNPLDANVKKLKAHRITALVENPSVLEYARKSIKELQGVVLAGCMPSNPLYIGVGAKHAKAADIVKAVNATAEKLRQSGELDKILAKYGMKAW